MTSACHAGGTSAAPTGNVHLALIGNPNSGKSTMFNALTGLKTKVANYAGVTVTRTVGTVRTAANAVTLEDLPGVYSLDPISPDERIAVDILEGNGPEPVDGVVVVVDATSLRRSLGLLAQVQNLGLPTLVVLNFVEDLTRLGGRVDVDRLARATGATVVAVDPRNGAHVRTLAERLAAPHTWSAPVIPPPLGTDEQAGWVESVLAAAGYEQSTADPRTRRIDAVLLHPLWGTLIFFAAMLTFFQVIFTLAAPLQDLLQAGVDALAELVRGAVGIDWLQGLLADGLIGGVGGVLVFLPQIALLFLMISLMEKSGYMARAAFLMDRVMGAVGLEGRAFVAMLSSLACAIPGIMATRSLPNARDRLATMMTAPLMTCSARLPVYTLLISAFIPLKWQGVTMFALYVLGAVATMLSAKVFTFFNRGQVALPFYMQMPMYRLPRPREIALDIWHACEHFLRRVSGIIFVLSLVLWAALYFPNNGDIDASFAAAVGHFLQPIFAPLGFDWRITLGLVTAMGAREMFVGTMAQVAPDLMLTPDVAAALLVYFALALQCVSTIAVLRRESGSWTWPAVAFGYMTALAWVGAFVAKTVVGALM